MIVPPYPEGPKEFVCDICGRDCRPYASKPEEEVEMIEEGWCLITFCPRKGPIRGNPENGLFICDRHWDILHKEENVQGGSI